MRGYKNNLMGTWRNTCRDRIHWHINFLSSSDELSKRELVIPLQWERGGDSKVGGSFSRSGECKAERQQGATERKQRAPHRASGGDYVFSGRQSWFSVRGRSKSPETRRVEFPNNNWSNSKGGVIPSCGTQYYVGWRSDCTKATQSSSSWAQSECRMASGRVRIFSLNLCQIFFVCFARFEKPYTCTQIYYCIICKLSTAALVFPSWGFSRNLVQK